MRILPLANNALHSTSKDEKDMDTLKGGHLNSKDMCVYLSELGVIPHSGTNYTGIVLSKLIGKVLDTPLKEYILDTTKQY